MVSSALVQVEYSQLVEFSTTARPCTELLKKIEEAYGVDGLGIVEVQNVPNFEKQRQALLPLAAKLPLLSNLDDLVDEKSEYSIGWSHGKETLSSGKPDKAKGSFYVRPFDPSTENRWPTSTLPELQTVLSDMATTLQDVGCLIGEVCDAYCSSRGLGSTNIAQSLRSSRIATGRLLHYFSVPDSDSGDTWCAWHNDHGSLTGLVPGMYLDENHNIVADPPGGGLFIETRNGQHVKVQCRSCAFQIGETAQIQSGGLLRATPHAVVQPDGRRTPGVVTRESFALFLEPPMEAPLELPEGRSADDLQSPAPESKLKLSPICDRWKPGGTFGDFHWNTIHMFAVKK